MAHERIGHTAHADVSGSYMHVHLHTYRVTLLMGSECLLLRTQHPREDLGRPPSSHTPMDVTQTGTLF